MAHKKEGMKKVGRMKSTSILHPSIHESQINTRRKAGIRGPKVKEEKVNTLHPCSPVVVTVNF